MAIYLKAIFLMVLTFYLVGLGFLLPAINKELNSDNQVNYTSVDRDFPVKPESIGNCDCGTLTCTEYQLIYQKLPDGCNNADAGQTSGKVTLVSSISALPLWFNTIFIAIPFIMWVIMIVLIVLPV